MIDNFIYLDNAATTSVDESVLKSYNKVVLKHNANSNSNHAYGRDASNLLEKSRAQILSLLGVDKTHTLLFTSGATESNNLAIKGVAFNYVKRGNHLITSKIEHPSVLNAFKQLEGMGFKVTYLDVDESGKISVDALKNAITKETILVSIMAVNNETGAVQPINEIAKLLKEYPKIYFHCDAVQGVGKVDIPYEKIDLITFTGHKIHGLKGSGALIKNKSISLWPLNMGGSQENGERSGTVDVAGAVALARALRLVFERKDEEYRKVKVLTKIINDYLTSHSELYYINSNIDENPFVINFSLKTKKAAVVVEALSREGYMVSSVSACHSKGEALSQVVLEMHHDENLAHNTIRVSPLSDVSEQNIEKFLQKLDEIVKGIR